MLIDQAIDAFWQCATQRVPPPAEWIGRLDRETAYRVQLGVPRHHGGGSDPPGGWKGGLTSKAMQIQQRVHEPVFGFLLASGDRASGARLPFAELINPGFENELCLTVGRAVRGPGITTEHAPAPPSGGG